MRNIIKYMAAAFSAMAMLPALTSCSYDEDDLTPSGITSVFTLPQGNHDYDATIQNYYDNYGIYLLYKFSDKDAYWTPSGWNNGVVTTDASTEGKEGFIVTAADENYVGQQLDLLNEIWFSKIPDGARKALLPTVILLCSEVDNVSLQWDFSSWPAKSLYNPSPITAHYNFDNVAVSYGSSAVTTLTADQKTSIARDLYVVWVNYLSERKVTPTDEFTNSINYSSNDVKNAGSPADACAAGTLNSGYQTSVAADWELFLDMMLMYPESFLTEDAGDLSSFWSFTNYVNGGYVYNYEGIFHGILNSSRDTKGILRQRYDLVRNYFINTYGFDPQSVGNSITQ